MALSKISEEQSNIILQILLNNNVIVDSVAGSGKTTSNLHIAKYFDNKNILLLTYNTKLRVETNTRREQLKLTNLEVHTYHSFTNKYYESCPTDSEIKIILKNKNVPRIAFNYDLIILDEAQDITSLYFELICKICKDNIQINIQICIFGDKKQSIFGFNNADQRFMEYATKLFNNNNWVKCDLSVSFRLTDNISLFVNKCLLKQDRIKTNKPTMYKPRYIICDCFNTSFKYPRTFREVVYYLKMGYKPEDIFILAPSIKNNNAPIRLLENRIKQEISSVMIYVPTSDDEKLNDEILKNKMVFSTIHQTKGLERKVVILFNFDSSYFEFYNKNADKNICPNELYVATTRSSEHLTLIHHYKNNYLNFIIDNSLILQYCYFEEDKKLNINIIDSKPKGMSVTNIIKFLPQHIIDECYSKLNIINNINYIKNKIDIPIIISNNETTEQVSDITGIAIPSWLELKLKGKMSIFNELLNNNYENRIKIKHKLKNIKNIQKIKSDELLYISNLWNSYSTGFLYKIYQIKEYNWLEQHKLNNCLNRLNNFNISKNSLFEYKIELKEYLIYGKYLTGFIDCIDIDNNILYEFKCTQEIKKEHYLQLALYMYMYELKNKNKTKTKYVLYNIITNEYIEISCEFEKLKTIVEQLIYTKITSNEILKDDEFIKINKKIYTNYFNNPLNDLSNNSLNN